MLEFYTADLIRLWYVLTDLSLSIPPRPVVWWPPHILLVLGTKLLSSHSFLSKFTAVYFSFLSPPNTPFSLIITQIFVIRI